MSEEKIIPEQRKALVKEISFALALCSSPNQERKADAALEQVEKFYDLKKKG